MMISYLILVDNTYQINEQVQYTTKTHTLSICQFQLYSHRCQTRRCIGSII